MKAFHELTADEDVDVLIETKHCAMFTRGGALWFANDIGDGGWYESKSLCCTADIYRKEFLDALLYEQCRAAPLFVDRATTSGELTLTPTNRDCYLKFSNPQGFDLRVNDCVMVVEVNDIYEIIRK